MGRCSWSAGATSPGWVCGASRAGTWTEAKTSKAAAKREVLEETGLKVEVTEVVGVYSQPGHPVILIIYDSRIVEGAPEPGPEVLELGFFPTEELPPLAFHRDRQVLESWQKLRDGH